MDRIDKLLEEFDFEDFEPLMTSGNKMQLFPTEDAQSIKNILSAPSTVEPEIFDNSRPGDIGPHLGGKENWEKNQQDFFQQDPNAVIDNSRPGGIKPYLEPVPAPSIEQAPVPAPSIEQAPVPAPSIEQAPAPSTPDSSRSLKKALTTAGGLGGIGLAAHYHDKKNK